MRTTVALFSVGLLSVCLLGCTTTGRSYADAKVAMIKKDVTTEADLLEWFGPASTRMMGPDGTKALSWTFLPAGGHATRAPGRLDVRLDTNGKVITYSGSAGLRR